MTDLKQLRNSEVFAEVLGQQFAMQMDNEIAKQSNF